jgi:hypothetical protein
MPRMSDVIAPTDAGAGRAPRPKVRQPKTDLPSIEIDGETWQPRKDFAAAIGVCDTTVKRMNTRSILVGGVSYINVKETLHEIASRARRRNEAPQETSPVRRRHRHQR